MKLIHVVGARPNFIKLWPVYEAAEKVGAEQTIVHTGQHYDYEMSKMFFDELHLPQPDVNLNVGSGTHAWQTGLIMLKLEDCLRESDRRAIVMVYGDVNSTMAAAVTAVKLGFRIAHVEAGIRSWDNSMPEEINRKIVDEISDYLFYPSRVARDNLSFMKGDFVGDVTYDAFLKVRDDLPVFQSGHIFITIHRENNTEESGFRKIEGAIKALTEKGDVIFSRHPRLKKLTDLGMDPIPYKQTLSLIKKARLVITDSGGIQKEAFWSGVPCIVVRNSTEWPELVESGWNVLVEPDEILDAVKTKTVGKDIPNPYGDGKAAEKIVEILSNGSN